MTLSVAGETHRLRFLDYFFESVILYRDILKSKELLIIIYVRVFSNDTPIFQLWIDLVNRKIYEDASWSGSFRSFYRALHRAEMKHFLNNFFKLFFLIFSTAQKHGYAKKVSICLKDFCNSVFLSVNTMALFMFLFDSSQSIQNRLQRGLICKHFFKDRMFIGIKLIYKIYSALTWMEIFRGFRTEQLFDVMCC